MASIFEEIMRTTPANLTESKKVIKKMVEAKKKINPKKIKIESRRILEADEADLDALDKQFEGDPTDETNDEVVLVIDPELDSDEEIPEDAAEEMVGDLVYKCPICGSNYVCNCDELSEDIEVDEDGNPVVCPVCGDDAEQILIGEIAPAEGAGEQVEEEPVEVEDKEEVEEVEDKEEVEELPDEEIIEDEEEEEDVEEESLELAPKTENAAPARRPIARRTESKKVDLEFNEVKFESMMTSVIKENYQGSPKFKVEKITSNGKNLNLFYTVTEGKKITRGKMVAEGFSSASRKMTLQFKDEGAFTKKAGKTPAFVVECVRIKNNIVPMNLKYDYKVRVNESLYRVYGKVGR